MPATAIEQRVKRKPGKLTPDESGALLNMDICPACQNPNVFRRPWREYFYCGWCRAVFKLVRGALHYIGKQYDVDRAERNKKGATD